MTVIFPKNNLPEPAQPWAREVQKQLANVITSDQANEVNNAARDNQLNSSLITLTKTVSDVKVASAEATAAITGLTGLGSSGSSYSINASNINAGTINASVVAVTNIDATNITAGRIVGGSGSATLDFESSNGASFFQVWDNNARMRGGSATIQCFDSTIILSGSVSASSLTVSSSSVFFTSLATDSSAANMRVGTGGGGQVFRSTASSRMFKNSIIPITEEMELDPKKLLDIPVVAFKYNEDYLRREDTRFNKMIPGFIAEDMKEIYPIAIEQDGGDATDWNPRYVVPSMLALIQELYIRIETLENGA